MCLNNQFDKGELKLTETVDKNHGRIEMRRYALSTDLNWLEQKQHWLGVNSVVMVESTRQIKEKVSVERCYYLSSLTDLNVISQYIRQHWVLDVCFNEDNSIKLESNVKNQALLTWAILNLIRQNGDTSLSVKCHRIKASQNEKFRF